MATATRVVVKERMDLVEPQEATEIGECRIDRSREPRFELRLDRAGESFSAQDCRNSGVEIGVAIFECVRHGVADRMRHRPDNGQRSQPRDRCNGDRSANSHVASALVSRDLRYSGSQWKGSPAVSIKSNATGLDAASSVTRTRINVDSPFAAPVPVSLNVSTAIPEPGSGIGFLPT